MATRMVFMYVLQAEEIACFCIQMLMLLLAASGGTTGFPTWRVTSCKQARLATPV